MRRQACLLACSALLAALATFEVWWNYAALAWSYPRYKLEVRYWAWSHFGDPIDWQRRRVAGLFAVDCSTKASDESELSECVRAALLRHHGFHSRAKFCGFDACGATAIIGSGDGKAYEVWLDLWNDQVRVLRRRCPLPLRISAESFRRYTMLSCLPAARSEQDFEVLRDDGAEYRNWNRPK